MTTLVGFNTKKKKNVIWNNLNFIMPWTLTAASDIMPNTPLVFPMMNEFSFPNQTISHLSLSKPQHCFRF